MKLHYLNKSGVSNIQYSETETKEFLKLWHYHPELELVYIVHGKGTLFAGDFIGNFNDDTIFLLGSNLPHMFDSHQFTGSMSKSIVLHFNPIYLQQLGALDQFSFLKQLINSCERGVMIDEVGSQQFKSLFFGLGKLSKEEQGLQALFILLKLAHQKKLNKLGSPTFVDSFSATDDRLNKVFEFIMMHFKETVDLKEVAGLAGMNKSSFCRYFKQKTQKTFVEYLNTLRVNYACRLLKDTSATPSITQICFDSGFNSLSYFNRIFKKYKGLSPSEYLLSS